MAGERLFPVPGTGPQSQAAELTAHKTREPQPRLPRGHWGHGGDAGRNTAGLWAARGTHDKGCGSTSMMCNTIRCLLLFTWAIQVSLELVVP